MSLVSLRSNRLSLHQVMGYPLIGFRSVEMSDKRLLLSAVYEIVCFNPQRTCSAPLLLPIMINYLRWPRLLCACNVSVKSDASNLKRTVDHVFRCYNDKLSFLTCKEFQIYFHRKHSTYIAFLEANGNNF